MDSYHLLNSTVFSAMKSTAVNRSASVLASEESQDRDRGLDSIQSLRDSNRIKINDGNGISNADAVTVMFNEPKNGHRITLSLTKENFDRLKQHFNADDFYLRNDGVIRLNGEAESFIAGWFGDIAYKQNYIDADKNKDGRINEMESSDLRSTVAPRGVFYTDGSAAIEESVEGYLHFDERFDSNHHTIEDALNTIVAKDTNLDGNLERFEYHDENDAIAQIDTYIQEFLDKLRFFDAMSMNNKQSNGLLDLANQFTQSLNSLTSSDKELLNEQQLAFQALRKLQTTGDINSLSPEERKALESASMIFVDKKDKGLDAEEFQKAHQEITDKSLEVLSDATGLKKEDIAKLLSYMDTSPSLLHGLTAV